MYYAIREKSAPYFWIVKDDKGNKIDRCRYGNELKDRYENLVFIDHKGRIIDR